MKVLLTLIAALLTAILLVLVLAWSPWTDDPEPKKRGFTPHYYEP